MGARSIVEGELLSIEQLPPEIRAEAEKTFSDDFLNNNEGDLRWRLTEVDPRDFDLEHELLVAGRTEELMPSVRRHGVKVPVVIGPEAIEGNHRLAAAQRCGIARVPAYVWEMVD